METALNTIHQGDCVAGLAQLPAGSVDLAFADPPFNIGYEYDVYNDNKNYHAYLRWTREWMSAVCRVLKSTGTFWVAIGDEYAAEIKLLAQNELRLTCRSWVIWYYTFGVNCTKKFNRSHAHLFHFVKDRDGYTFNEDEICVPSARQLVYADGRAHPAGRLPDDTWILRPQDAPNGFPRDQATWYFPRVAGTFKERAGFHGCQMPEQLLGRIIRTSSNPREIVVDPFAGSGTTLVVAKKLGRRWVGYELSEEYAKQARGRVKRARVGEPLEGAPEPIVSAPRTPGKSSTVWLRAGVNAGVRRALIEAFLAASDGWSSDRVIVDPKLNGRFCKKCRDLKLLGGPADWNRLLMRLRKAGKLKGLPKPRRTTFPDEQLDRYIFASEIAMGLMISDVLSLDDILCDPEQARAFDEIASSYAPGFSSLQYRWAALTIRKRAHDFRERSQNLPAALEHRKFLTFQAVLQVPVERLQGVPGVYLARKRDERNLYLGETYDLSQRFQQHLQAKWRDIANDIEFSLIELDEIDPRDRWGLQTRLIGEYTPELNYLEPPVQ